MIATVRIAPMEHWCAALLKDLTNYPKMSLIVGQEVQIHTMPVITHIQSHGDETRWWNLTLESRNKLMELMDNQFPCPGVSLMVCEHLLEMD